LKKVFQLGASLLLLLSLADAQQTRFTAKGGNWAQEITGNLAAAKNLHVKVDVGTVRVQVARNRPSTTLFRIVYTGPECLEPSRRIRDNVVDGRLRATPATRTVPTSTIYVSDFFAAAKSRDLLAPNSRLRGNPGLLRVGQRQKATNGTGVGIPFFNDSPNRRPETWASMLRACSRMYWF